MTRQGVWKLGGFGFALSLGSPHDIGGSGGGGGGGALLCPYYQTPVARRAC